MSLKVWKGSLTWINQCTMSATLTQAFQHNLISISEGEIYIYVQLSQGRTLKEKHIIVHRNFALSVHGSHTGLKQETNW